MRIKWIPVRAGWNWWWGFGLLITLPALILALLGLRAVRIERLELNQQLREQQTQIARLADAAIANALTELDTELNRTDNAEPKADGSPLVGAQGYVFSVHPQDILIFRKEKVFFGASPRSTEVIGELVPVIGPNIEEQVERAQAAEAQGRPGEALNIYSRIAAAEPRLHAWAEFSHARINLEQGDSEALARLSDPAWSRTEDRTPTGLPLALIAATYVDSLTRAEQPKFQMLLQQTLEGLRANRWWLSYDERRFYDRELQRLLISMDPQMALSADTRLDELAALEQLLRQVSPQTGKGVFRSFGRVKQQAFLLLIVPQAGSDIWRGLAVPQPRASELLNGVLRPLLSGQSFSATVREAQGEIVWGQATTTPVWNVVGLTSIGGSELAFTGPSETGWLDQRRLVWYGLILLLLLMLLVGLAMTAHVMRREAELARLQNDFIAAVSHEFKSPLTSMRLLIERLNLGRFPVTGSANEYYVAMGRETDRLERLVNRLLRAQQIQSGRNSYSFASLCLPELVREAIKDLQPQAEARKIWMEVNAETDIPPVALDRAALTEALQNLIDNAIKYSPAGTRITVGVRAVDHQVCVDIQEQGIGIAGDELPRVFDKFYRGKRGDMQNVHGTGLGLALVKATIEDHGGHVRVTSIPGEGSCFSVWLPTDNKEGNNGSDSSS
jgi:signal transduction histidine kinase